MRTRIASLSFLLMAGVALGQEKPAPVVKASGDGLSIVSADGANQIRLGGYLQVDGRFLLGESGNSFVDTFAVRRARPIFDAKLGERFAFRLVTDFGEGKVAVQDAWFDTRIGKSLTFRAGKQKTPLGLERLASDAATFFAERGLPTELVPNRDIGFVVNGTWGGGRVEASAGVLNGVVDGAAPDISLTDGKEVAGRLFVKPFARKKTHPLKGLGLGLAATTGTQEGLLGAYRTPALQTFFTYAKNTLADGRRTRFSPQASFHGGPVGVMAEFVRSSPTVTKETVSAQLDHDAWQVAVGVALTGEAASASGIKPKRPLGSGDGAFGALELVARYGALGIDPDTFTLGLASSATSASEANSFGVGVNWYLTRNVRWLVDYERTSFVGGAASGDRSVDNALTFRGQVAF